MLQAAKLVQDAAQGPYITFSGIRVALAGFWTHVVWGTDHSLSGSIGVFQDSADTKITQLDCIVASKKDVLGLEISMNYSSAVDIFES
jgi:hypothetical protein